MHEDITTDGFTQQALNNDRGARRETWHLFFLEVTDAHTPVPFGLPELLA